MRRNKTIYYISLYALYTALMAVLSYVPYVGYISFGVVSMTTVHLLVLVFAYLMGWKHGWALGLIFGLFSLIKAATQPTGLLDPYFVNPLISLLPRMSFGLLAGFLFDLTKKFAKDLKYQTPFVILTSAITTLFHSVFVLGMLGICNFNVLDAALADNGGYWAAFGATMLVNALPETALAAVVVCPVAFALRYPYHYVFGGKSVKNLNLRKTDFYKDSEYRELVKPYLLEAKNELINFLKINSIYDESTVSKDMPYGEGVEKALTYIADLGKRLGFKVDRCDHRCTELSFGEGELLDIYAHADVVPVSKTWKHDPFNPSIEGDTLYARGSTDDKGPGLSALYAAKALMDNGKLYGFKLRIVFGGDEERGSSCLEYYFHTLKKEYPTYGFTPDSDFPMIYAEKSIHTVELSLALKELNEKINNFAFGSATNVVLGECSFTFKNDEANLNEVIKKYSSEHKDITISEIDNGLIFKGKSVHGAVPWEGVNAGLHMLNFLGELYGIDSLKKIYKALIDGNGKEIGGDFTSEAFDSTSYAVGVMSYDGKSLSLKINLRIPENITIDAPIEKLTTYTGAKVKDLGGCDALLIPLDSPLVKTLLKVYQDETGDITSKPLAIGGGTYAKESKNTLAFGPTFPGRDFLIHQDDEYIYLSDYENYIGIYAHAIDAVGALIRGDK